MNLEVGVIIVKFATAVIELLAKAIPFFINLFLPPKRASRAQKSLYNKYGGRFPGAWTNKCIALSKIAINCRHVKLYGGGSHLAHLPRVNEVLSNKQITLLKQTGCSISLQDVPTPEGQNKGKFHESLLINIVSKEQVNSETALLAGALCLEFDNDGKTDLIVCGVESGFSVLSKSSSNPIAMPPLSFRAEESNRRKIAPKGQLKFSVAYAYDPLKSGTSIDVRKIASLPELMKNKTVTICSQDGQDADLKPNDCFLTEDVAFLVRLNDERTKSSYYYLTGWTINNGYMEMRDATGTEALLEYAESIAGIEKATGMDYKNFVGFLSGKEDRPEAVYNANVIHKAIRKARKGKSIRHARLKYW